MQSFLKYFFIILITAQYIDIHASKYAAEEKAHAEKTLYAHISVQKNSDNQQTHWTISFESGKYQNSKVWLIYIGANRDREYVIKGNDFSKPLPLSDDLNFEVLRVKLFVSTLLKPLSICNVSRFFTDNTVETIFHK